MAVSHHDVKHKQKCQFWFLLVGFIVGVAVTLTLEPFELSLRSENEEATNATTATPAATEEFDNIKHVEEEIQRIKNKIGSWSRFSIGIGFLSIMTFLLFLFDCSKQDKLLIDIISSLDQETKERNRLKRSVKELDDKIVTIKVDVLDDLEANLFGKKALKPEALQQSQLVLTPNQAAWMVPEDGDSLGSLPGIRY